MKEIGNDFDPQEPYTHRLRSILGEYPEGSQVLREILQNSDDAMSTEQIFILDHNTYPSDRLIEPRLNNYKKIDLKLDRYQGPALLAKNDTVFEERDLQSLKKLANSEKRDQFNKIGGKFSDSSSICIFQELQMIKKKYILIKSCIYNE